MSFGPLPIQKYTIETTLMQSPSMPVIVCVWQIYDGSSRVSSHCTLLQSIVQAYHKMQTTVQTIPHVKGTRRGVISLQCKILVPHGSWFLVMHALCLSEAGWSWPACRLWRSHLILFYPIISALSYFVLFFEEMSYLSYSSGILILFRILRVEAKSLHVRGRPCVL